MYARTGNRRSTPPRIRKDVWMKVKPGAPTAIRRKRQELRYSQRDLAFLVRRTQATIWAIENDRLPTLTEALAIDIASRLGIPWEDLFVAEESDRMPGVTNAQSRTGRPTAAALAATA
jgi:putative transcriptional regulator